MTNRAAEFYEAHWNYWGKLYREQHPLIDTGSITHWHVDVEQFLCKVDAGDSRAIKLYGEIIARKLTE